MMDGIKQTQNKSKLIVRPVSRGSQMRRGQQLRGAVRLDDVAGPQQQSESLSYITPLAVPKPPSILRHYLVRSFLIVKFLLFAIYRSIINHLKQLSRTRALAYSFSVLMLVSFSGGMFVEWSASPLALSAPELASTQVLSASDVMGPVKTSEEIDPFEVFVGLLDDQRSTPPSTENADAYAARKLKLQNYLAYQNSPLAKDDKALDTLLHSTNMKMILALSFVESTFCRKQVDHNCSGIGVSPDHPDWHSYRNFSDWVIDLDRLLERRYKGWTPEEMRGVYVQPGSDNWVNGIKRIVKELTDAGIE